MKRVLLSLIVGTIILAGCSSKESTYEKKSSTQKENKTSYADMGHKDFIDEQVLHDAVRSKDLSQVKLATTKTKHIDQKDIYGYTPLHIAARLNQLEIVKHLIEKGATVNSMDKYQDTPLLDSTRDNYTEISKVLICNGAERKVEDRYQMTPMHYSAKSKNELISEMLLSNDLSQYCNNMEKQIEEKPLINEEISEENTNMTEESLPTLEASEIVVETPLSEVSEFKGLYEALNEEFQNDFEPWEAELTKDDLVFRFYNPVALFEKGEGELKPGFKNILDDFIPRYLKVLQNYQENIQEVRIEGHTSSEYESAQNDKQRYQLNKELSQKRANRTKEYVLEVLSSDPMLNQKWFEETFQAYGMSYDNIIVNFDGTENKEASRRVDFKIVRK